MIVLLKKKKNLFLLSNRCFLLLLLLLFYRCCNEIIFVVSYMICFPLIIYNISNGDSIIHRFFNCCRCYCCFLALGFGLFLFDHCCFIDAVMKVIFFVAYMICFLRIYCNNSNSNSIIQRFFNCCCCYCCFLVLGFAVFLFDHC